MWRFNPMDLAVVFCWAAFLCAMVASLAPGMIGVWALIAMSFFLSIQMPTFLGHALVDLGEMAKSGAAIIMFVAFSGAGVIGLGALLIVPLGVHAIMILPALCFVGAGLCAMAMRRAEAVERLAAPAS